ncbi:MAG: VOC family protein [Rhodospirillales bacterium]|jgi:catechol 2,3-dioxygenase-like lactoylglutathione lyase family enzyme|nr:VOC family protein [Rhodospirillales bacterium]
MFNQQVTFLYTRDLEGSVQFYSEFLELQLTLDQGSCKIFQVSPNAFLGICACNEQRPSNPEGIIVTLVTSDVDGWYEKLKSKGVRFDAPPSENTKFNIYHCFLRDPDGYQIEIQQFRDPAWPKPLVGVNS